MAASLPNSWINTSLLSPSSQQQSAQHALYSPDLQMHSSAHLSQQQVDLGQDDHDPCGSFCQPQQCPRNLDFQESPDNQQLPDFNRSAGSSGQVGTTGESVGHVSARKVHKADREKLRRDRLNEQFAELAGVLDPDRPKNDKATILGDSVQVVKELRAEVKRLRAEQNSLLDESRDLAQEKTELREEKATLKTETEQLQVQLQQRLRLLMPWMGMDPSMMMGASPFGYPMQAPHQPVSGPPPSDMNQPLPQAPLPQSVAPPPAYIPMAPAGPGSFGVHPALQAYSMLGSRPGDGSAPYLPYPHYPPHPQVTSHSHVERPYPQYPSQMQPLPGYLMQMQHQGQPPMSGAPAVPSMYQSFTPGMALMPPRPQGTQPAVQSRGHPVAGPYGASGLQSYVGHPVSPSAVQTDLQLQTPLHPQPLRASEVGGFDAKGGSTNGQSGGTGLSSGLQKGSHIALQAAPTYGVGDSTNWSPTYGVGDSTNRSPSLTGSAALRSPGGSSTGTGGEAVSQDGKDKCDSSEAPDETIRAPAA